MTKGKTRRIEVMDTTLRDGEQAEGISMMPEEKRTIAQRLLETVKVDRIEVASARVSEGEHRAVKTIIDYADSKGWTDRIEILGFVDGNRSVDWAKSVGARVINLLTKGSLHHCREQLKKTHEQHLDDIRRTIEYGAKNGITFNVYLEDWSGGMIGCVDYVDGNGEAITEMPVKRIMLPDTLGLLSPVQVREFVGRIIGKFPNPHFDFHGHNDYGLGTANTLEAAIAGAHGVHVTVNGMGERAGNANLGEIALALAALYGVDTGLRLDRIRALSERVRELCGYELEPWKPLVGENLFRRESGAVASQFHDPPSIEPYSSELVGATRGIVLGKKSGLDSIRIKAEQLGVELDDDGRRELLAAVKGLGERERRLVTDEEFLALARAMRPRA
jgi:(R)-citramalate synthase